MKAIFPLIIFIYLFQSFNFSNEKIEYTDFDNSVINLNYSGPNDTFVATNIYSYGQLSSDFGYPDTLQVQIERLLAGSRIIKVLTLLRNNSPTGPIKDTLSIVIITDNNVYDTLLNVPMPDDPLMEKTDFVVVEILPGDGNVVLQDDTTNNKKIYRLNTTFGRYNHTQPGVTSNIDLGYTGRTANFVAGFRNQSTTATYHLKEIDYCIKSSTNSGTKPFRIIVYGDNGSGKPGSQLHASGILFPPSGANVPTHVLYTLNSAISISPGNRFYIGYRQTSVNSINACAQAETPVRPKEFFFTSPDTGSTWYDFRDSSINKVPDITAIGYSILNMTMLQEGFYNAGSNTKFRDTNRVYIRSNISPYQIRDTAKSYDNANGTGSYFFPRAMNGTSYYLEVVHRNSINTWSASAQSFTSNSLTFDFTSAASQAFGSNMIQVDASPLEFAIYGGDVIRDGSIDVGDVITVYNDASNFVTGYVVSDVNGDDFVDIADLVICYNNSANFVSQINP